MLPRAILAGLALAILPLTPPAGAQPTDEATLAARINAYRTLPQSCGGQQRPAAQPLALVAPLSRAAAAGLSDRAVLEREGYNAGRVEVVRVERTRDAGVVMDILQSKYCQVLLDPGLTELGLHREGGRWTVVLAQPLLDPQLGDWRAAGTAVLALVNEARAQPRQCGERLLAAASPLTWSEPLAAAALAHSRDMAQHDRFDHSGSDGSSVADRVRRQKHRFRGVGENIAAGPGSPRQVVEGWLRSPGHCENIMRTEFRQMGAAYVEAPTSAYGVFWTQVFGW